MLKIIWSGYGLLVGLAGVYLAVYAPALSKSVRVDILVVLIVIGIAALAYSLGLRKGQRTVGRSLRNLGILRAFRRANADATAPLSKSIQNATSDIFFMGLSLPKLDSYNRQLRDKACNGVQVRLLVPDPCEEWLVLAIAKFLKREETYPRELSWFFNQFLPAWKEAPNNFHVGVYKQIPTMSAAMFDKKQGNVELYMYGWMTDDRLILELDFGGAAREWKKNLDMIWTEATELSSEKMFRKRIKAADGMVHKLKENVQTSKS